MTPATNADEIRQRLQNFLLRLNQQPEYAEKTPDGKAWHVPISHVETTLDELYFGLWDLTDCTYQQIFNEVVATGVLTVIHPVTLQPIKRTGFAAVVITQDSGANIQDFNSTKKKNALDLTFPKLKAEILKNAAASLGNVFGKNINRKNPDTYKPAINYTQALPSGENVDTTTGEVIESKAAEFDVPFADELREATKAAVTQQHPDKLTAFIKQQPDYIRKDKSFQTACKLRMDDLRIAFPKETAETV